MSTTVHLCGQKSLKKKTNEQLNDYMQCLQDYIGTSAFADVSYLMADVEAKFYV